MRRSAELTLAEGRRVSVAELVRRATLSEYMRDQETSDQVTISSAES